MSKIQQINRRDFVKLFGLASGGILLGCNVASDKKEFVGQEVGAFSPNLFIQIEKNGKITLIASRSEMGQGIRTSLASAITDELEADWKYIKVKQATGNDKYGNQNTDGSRSVRTMLAPMRKMGATAKKMLIIAAAKKWVPVLVGIMAGAFASYLALKGLKKIIKIDLQTAIALGLIFGVITWAFTKPIIAKQSVGMENRNKSLKKLFNIPLIVSAALLSFAHGANDVANAVGPLAAIVQASSSGEYTAAISIPLWVMVIGAAGISFGLFLFGPKLINVVGNQITKLNQMRAYCVALSAAITVIVASWLGLPVSSTHIAVGAVFGVGFFREWDTAKRMRSANLSEVELPRVAKEERKRRKLVRRSHFMSIIAAWIITVPCAAVISGIIFSVISSATG